MAALLGVTVFDTLPGLFIGIAVSFVLLLYRASRPRVAELARAPGAKHYAALDQIDDGERVPGVVILRVEAGLFFANADWVRDHVRDVLRRAGSEPRLQRVYGSVRAAVEASQPDPDAPPRQEPAPS